MHKVATQVTELTSDANGILGSINDLVALPEIDHSQVMDDIQDVKEKDNDIVEELIILDNYETSQLEQTKDALHLMRTFIHDMESKFESGDLSIANYKEVSLQKLDSYKAIQDRVYSENEEKEIHIFLNIFSKMDENERIRVGMLAAENPDLFLTYLREHYSEWLIAFGRENLSEDIIHSDLYIDLLEKVSPVYNAYNKLVNILSANGPIAMIVNPGNFLPRLFQDKEIKSADIDKIKETEAYQNLAVKNQMTADEEAQLKNYLQNIDPDDRNSPYAPENDAHPDYGPITFWDKREVIVSNKDVTPDGLAGPTTATLTFMYALTIEDAVVFVDPNTELDEKVIAALFMIPTPAKFGKPFFKQADDLGGAANAGRRGKNKKDNNSLDSDSTVKSVSNMNEFFDLEFGKTISNSLSKSKVRYDGQSIYKIEKKIDSQYLKKGYGVYLDALHKDHLEVIDKRGNVKYVLNLDGTLNLDKTKKIYGRVVNEWK